MKRIVVLAIGLLAMLTALGGCFIGYPDHHRDGYDRDREHHHDWGEHYDYHRDSGHEHYHNRDRDHDERY